MSSFSKSIYMCVETFCLDISTQIGLLFLYFVDTDSALLQKEAPLAALVTDQHICDSWEKILGKSTWPIARRSYSHANIEGHEDEEEAKWEYPVNDATPSQHVYQMYPDFWRYLMTGSDSRAA